MTALIQTLRPSSKIALELTLAAFFSFLLALLAQFSIPLPFSPVPLSLQTAGIFLIGALLGSKRAAFATLAYLLEGALGWPVFAGGMGGVLCLVGPRGGYLIGFVIAAYFIGYLVERRKEANPGFLSLTFLLGNLVIWVLGALWLSLFVGGKAAFYLGVYPFLIGDGIKIALVTLSFPYFKKYLNTALTV